MSRIFFKGLYVFLMLSMCLVCAMQISAQEPSLAEQVFQAYRELLLREDVHEILPTALIELKKPENTTAFNVGDYKRSAGRPGRT